MGDLSEVKTEEERLYLKAQRGSTRIFCVTRASLGIPSESVTAR